MFQNSNPGPARVCLRHTSVEAAVCDFASFLKIQFVEQITQDPKAFKKTVIRLLRRELPPKRGRPNDPRLNAAVEMIRQGRSVKDVLWLQIPDFGKMDVYSRYLAEKGLRTAIRRRLSLCGTSQGTTS